MYQRGSHWTDFREIWYWELSWKSREIPSLVKVGQNIVHFTWRPITFYCCPRHNFAIKAFLYNTKYFCIVILTHRTTMHNALLRLHCNNGCANPSQCYFTRTLPVLVRWPEMNDSKCDVPSSDSCTRIFFRPYLQVIRCDCQEGRT